MRKIRQLQNSRKSYSPLTRLWRNTRKTCATYETFLVTLLSWIIPSLFSVHMASFYAVITFPTKNAEDNLYTQTSFLFPFVILFWLFYDSQLPMMLDQYLQRITALWFCAAAILLCAYIFEPIYLFPRICVYFVLWWAVYVVLIGYLQKPMPRFPLRTFVSDYQKREMVQFICWRLGAIMLFLFEILLTAKTITPSMFLLPPVSSADATGRQLLSFTVFGPMMWLLNRRVSHSLYYYPDYYSENVSYSLTSSKHQFIKDHWVSLITTVLATIYIILLLIFCCILVFAYLIGVAARPEY